MTALRLDVRPFHERGEEPYAAIMGAVDSLAPDQDFLLVNSFEPTPLYRVMDKRGFTHQTTELSADEWHITFQHKPEERTIPVNTLDVRVIPPREKHPTIHARLNELEKGQILTIVNDHDPRSLRFELDGDYPGRYAWTYRESGPETWRVDIECLSA